MSFYNKTTSELTGKIAALKTIVEKSKTKYDSKVSSANTLMDSIMEIFIQIGGYDDMLSTIEIILSEKIDYIEQAIKSAIKIAIKQILSCSVEPTISDDLIFTGVTFSITNIDPMSILTIDPESENGTYAYFDNHSNINSLDFNVFLYSLIKNSINNQSYAGSTWYKVDIDGNEEIKRPIVNVSYSEYDSSTNETNILRINVDSRFQGEKLSYFISEFLDSIKLFNNVQILSSIFDEIFGTKIVKISKTSEQLISEDIISKIVDNILNNADDGDVIDDSYYQFSNDVYNEMIENAEKRKKGVYTYNNNTNTNVNINQEELLSYFGEIKSDSLLISQQTKIISNTIDQITENIANSPNVDEKQKYNIKLNIVNDIIKKLINTVTRFIFTPKILYLFVMVNEILRVENDMNIITFIKKNINLYKTIILSIRDIIIQELINKIKLLLAPIIKEVSAQLVKEKFILYKKQMDTIRNALLTIKSTI